MYFPRHADRISMESPFYWVDILFLVRIPLASAFVFVHYLLNQLVDFDQTGIDTLLGGREDKVTAAL